MTVFWRRNRDKKEDDNLIDAFNNAKEGTITMPNGVVVTKTRKKITVTGKGKAPVTAGGKINGEVNGVTFVDSKIVSPQP